jgi:hypothetical protein
VTRSHGRQVVVAGAEKPSVVAPLGNGRRAIARRVAAGQRLPVRNWDSAAENFGDTPASTGGGVIGQFVPPNEPRGEHFEIGHSWLMCLMPLTANIDRHVIAPRYVPAEVEPEQLRSPVERDAGLLVKLAGQRISSGFTGLDTAAREMPARGVTVLDQKNAALSVHDHRPDAQSDAAAQQRISQEETRREP